MAAEAPKRPRKDDGSYYTFAEIKGLSYNNAKRKQYREWYEVERKKNVREKEKINNDDRQTTNLEQYILNQNIDKTTRYYSSNKHLFNYMTYRQINGHGGEIINKLRGVNNLGVFYKVKKKTLSLLQPKIRIYKVFYNEYKLKPNGTVDTSTIKPLSVPCYKEIKFSDNFGQETAATVSEYLAHESTKPTFRNVGLKSFSFKHDGRNFGVIENNIECSLQVVFKSLKDLKAVPPGGGGGTYADLIMYPPAKINDKTELINPHHYRIKVFLGYTAPTAQQLQRLNLTEEEIRSVSNIEKLNIMVFLELQDYKIDIKEDGQVVMTGTYRGALETTVGSNQVNIFQDTIRLGRGSALHVSMARDSTQSLQHTYNLLSKLTSIYAQLNDAACKDDKCESRKELISLIEKDAFWGKIYLDVGGAGAIKQNQTIKVTDKEKAYEWFRNGENTDRMYAKLKQQAGLYKKDVYRTFTDQLVDGNNEDENSPGTRLFCFKASKKTVLKSAGSGKIYDAGEGEIHVADDPDEDDSPGSSSVAVPRGPSVDRCGRASELKKIDPAFVDQVANELVDIETETQEQQKKGTKKEDENKKIMLNWEGESYSFYYVYLGDIIELACKNAGMAKLKLGPADEKPIFLSNSFIKHEDGLENPLKQARILLGPLEYLDSKRQRKVINLSQFAISFNLFRAWFQQKVVRPDRAQLSLGAFLGSLMNDLVVPAMGAGMPSSMSTGGNIKDDRTHSNVVSLTLPGKQKGPTTDDNTGFCAGVANNLTELMPLNRVIDLDGPVYKAKYLDHIVKITSSESLVKTSFDYLFIYVSTLKDMKERKPNPVQDIKDGIYHFNIGSDMGLLKKMNFKRATLGYQAELASERTIADGDMGFRQLAFPHNTDITLIGTPLFTPGMFVYINPGLAGIGDPEDASSLASQLNIGGYHLIQEVRLTITPGKFESALVGQRTV